MSKYRKKPVVIEAMLWNVVVLNIFLRNRREAT